MVFFKVFLLKHDVTQHRSMEKGAPFRARRDKCSVEGRVVTSVPGTRSGAEPDLHVQLDFLSVLRAEI